MGFGISGSPRVEGNINPPSSVKYTAVANGICAVQGRFLKGPHDVFVLCGSEAEFYEIFGVSALVTGVAALDAKCKVDFEFVRSFFTASKGKGALWIKNVDHWDSGATTAVYATCTDMSGTRLELRAQYRGRHANDGEDTAIYATLQDASSGIADHYDLLIYEGSVRKKAYLNYSWSESASRSFMNAIPSAGDGYVVPTWNGETYSAPSNAALMKFVGGDEYYEDAGVETLVAADWIGEAGSYTVDAHGWYLLLNHLNSVSNRPMAIIDQVCSTDAGTGASAIGAVNHSNLETFCQTYRLSFYTSTPSGLTKSGAYDYMTGQSTYSAQSSKRTAYGEAKMSWPHGHYKHCSDDTLYIPPSAADAGLHAWVAATQSNDSPHTPAAGTFQARGFLGHVFDKMERETNTHDSALLDDEGVCVIRTDINDKIYMYGHVSTSLDGRFWIWSVRLLTMAILAGSEIQSEWMVHGLNDRGYPNSPGIRRIGLASLIGFMNIYADRGAYQSKTKGLDNGGGWDVIDITTNAEVQDFISHFDEQFIPRLVAKVIKIGISVRDDLVVAQIADEE